MKIKEKIILISLIFVSFLFLFGIQSYAGEQNWNSLDYDVTVNEDGSMDVIETWNIKISETNTVFKDFKIDNTKYSGISNVSVSEIYPEGEYYLTEIYEEQYHVDDGCFYALPISDDKFEIAWNVGLDNSTATKTYKLYYTIYDAVKVYNDCTELYWMFLGKDNEIPGENITGTIRLPEPVSDIETLRVWAHGPLSGNINKVSEDTVTFSVPRLSSNQMLEIRIVTEENIYYYSYITYNDNKLADILQEEQHFADVANAKRTAIKVLFVLDIIINIIVFIILIFKIAKYVKQGKSLKEQYAYSTPEIQYFREIPNEKNSTPARAIYMEQIKHYKPEILNSITNIFSATMLDLSLKGLVEFEPIDKKNVRIILKEKQVDLTEDENVIYEILRDATNSKNSITTKEFSDYTKKNYKKVYKKLTEIDKFVDNYEKENDVIDKKREEVYSKWNGKAWGYTITIIFMMVFFLPLILILVGLAGCAIVCGLNASKIEILTEKAKEEKNQWKALKKYMEEYSLLKEKETPDIVLWEKYLVYATAFGISEKVIEQLKIVHPEMFDINNMENNAYYANCAYWSIVCNNSLGTNSFVSLSKCLGDACDTARSAYSSSEGGGGGFSGGGGGRRRRRWLRRPLEFK